MLLLEFKREYDPQSTAGRYLLWEEACLDVSEFQSFSRMLDCVKSGSSHHSARYILEAIFWARTMVTRDAVSRLSKASSIARRFDLEGSESFWKIADATENLLNQNIDLMIRTNLLGKRLANTIKLASINQEMLVYLAAARTLARVGAFQFASFCLSEYVSRSLKTSNGQDDDVLKLADDLMQRPWFKRPEFDEAIEAHIVPPIIAAC
jgi:hypothetical protein